MTKDSKTTAKFWLEYLRSKKGGQYQYAADQVRSLAASGKFTLEDIGTGEEELARLLVENMKTEAKRWLESLRSKKGGQYQYAADQVRSLAASGKFTLEDIGTSEEELNQLLQAHAAADSLHC